MSQKPPPTVKAPTLARVSGAVRARVTVLALLDVLSVVLDVGLLSVCSRVLKSRILLFTVSIWSTWFLYYMKHAGSTRTLTPRAVGGFRYLPF